MVEEGLRAVLDEDPSSEPYVFDFPTVDGGELIVDPADRDALYDLMEGRG